LKKSGVETYFILPCCVIAFYLYTDSNITIMRVLFLCVLPLLLFSCKKEDKALPGAANGPAGYIKYTIKKGEHYTTENSFIPVDTAELDFWVQFDSSAIYATADPQNQLDINKLYGFADNGAVHQQYSARIGWRWSDGALHLFAFVHNASKIVSEEIAAVPIGKPIRCRLAVEGNKYLFFCNEWLKTVPRASTTPKGKGYLLYPYFGGDETAPHEVTIWIKNA